MDRKNMELAANLLAKAMRTDFDAEAIALLEKSYSLLAKVITAYDESVGPATPATRGTRRRERRLLRERRATRRLGPFGTADRKADPAGAYRRLDQDRQTPGHIDFEA
jgi:hypothetical protein